MAEEAIREDTMIYRAPTDETEVITDIWGKNLETRVVDASEVPAMLKDGWVTNPLHIDHPPKPEEAAGFVPDRGEVDALHATLEEAKKREDALAAEVAGLKDELKESKERETSIVASWTEEVGKLKADLKAAEELADGETKAKDEALAKVAELEAAAKNTLSIKGKPA